MFKLLQACLVMLATGALSGSCLAAVRPPAPEEALEGTLFAGSSKTLSGGALASCELSFLALVRDVPGSDDALVKIGGTFVLRRATDGMVFYALKLGLVDEVSGREVPLAPTEALVLAPDGRAPSPPIRKESGPGFALYLGDFDDDMAAAYGDIVGKYRLTLRFNRRAGAEPLFAVIDLMVTGARISGDGMVRTRSHAAVDGFSACTQQLFQRH